MTNEIWIQLLLGLLPTVVSIIALAFWMGRRFALIDSRFDQLSGRLDQHDRRFDQLSDQLGQHASRLDQLSSRLDQLELEVRSALGQLHAELAALTSFTAGLSRESTQSFALIIAMLKRRGELSEQEVSDVLERQVAMNDVTIEAYLGRERSGRNPLTIEQIDKLQYYVDKARRGERFSPAEVREFNNIVAIAERENPLDPGVFALSKLGAFLRGLKDYGPLEQSSERNP